MVSFIIAGKASDPSFARAEYAARQVQAMVPNIFVKLEMKHPDHWKAFLQTVCRLYDFSDYPDDFAGPLVWTLEGELIGSAADFVQKVCIEQFGIQDPPQVTDPMFKDIAAENLKQVKMQLQRELEGPSSGERCLRAAAEVQELGLIQPLQLEKRGFFSHGACIEVWIDPDLLARAAENAAAFGAGQAAELDERLLACKVGQEASHAALLHPRPLFAKQLCLVPSRCLEAPAAPAEAEEGTEAPAEEVAAEVAEAPEVPQSPTLLVPPHRFGSDASQDLSLQDFSAAAELLLQVPGVATWSGIRGTEFRHPLETHLQILPFPLSSPLRYPLELLIDRAAREAPISKLDAFPFRHYLLAIPQPEKPTELGKQMALTYDSVLSKLQGTRQDTSRLVAFTTSWMLVMPLAPPEPDTAEHEVWMKLPPMHPCALCGIAIHPQVEQSFPETAGGFLSQQRLVSSRAEEEGIPEDAAEYAAARKEVRISKQIYERPLETLGFWVK